MLQKMQLFAEAATNAAKEYHEEMRNYLIAYGQ
jgi:hypothetical protein